MIDVKITLTGVKALQDALTAFLDIVPGQLKDDLDVAGAFLVERAQQNTPIDTGALRESLQAQTTVSGSNASLRISSDLPYALRIHEDTYNLGPRSKEQPTTPEGGVGNKYITRVVNYWASEIQQRIRLSLSASVRKAFPSGAVRTLR